MMKRFHHEQLTLDGVMRLIKQDAGHGHPGVFKHRIPAGLLVPKPAPDTLAIGFPSFMRHVVRKVAEPLPQRALSTC